jgi:tetratricopeptide (TPR) repeat protein
VRRKRQSPRPIRHVLAALTILWCGAASVLAQEGGQNLTPAQMRGAAILAIDNGSPTLALEIAEALLARNPDDVIALILKARAARDLGRFDLAQPAAARAWDLADSPVTRFDSARVMAQILSSQGHRTRAQLWLRRAVQHAPDEVARNMAITEFRYVSARNRWNIQLNAALSPNSNINNGSVEGRTQILDFFTLNYVIADLSGAAVALSGIEASAGALLRYRLAESETFRTDLLMQGDLRRYRLSGEARRIAPTARAGDFALDSLSIGIDHRWRDQQRPVEYQIGALLGVTTYGGAHYADQARLSLGLNRRLDDRTGLAVFAGAEATRGPLAPHADSLRMGLGLSHATVGGTRLGARLSLTQSQSDRDVADFTDLQVDLVAEPTWSILGAETSLGLSFRGREYDRFILFSPDGRRDREVAANVTLGFTQAEFYGFVPTVTFEASRTRSNIGLYEVDRYGVQLGIRSAF